MAADQTLSPRATAQAGGGTNSPVVLWLDDPRARDRDLTGGKAAALADAASAGCPVVEGFVLEVDATAAIDDQGWRTVVDSASEA